MTFLDFLLSVWSAVWPFRFVRTGWQAVVFRLGVAEAAPRGPGWVWLWPGFWQYEAQPVTLRWIDLPPQSVTTKDGKVLAISANIGYRVDNLRAALCEVDDYELSMARLATGHIHGRVGGWTYAEVMDTRRDLETSVLGTLRTRAAPWGLTVEDVRLTDCTPTKVYRLFNEGL